MKKIFLLLFLWPILMFGQSVNKNFVKTATYRDSTLTTNESKAQVAVTYHDGFGRPVQTTLSKASANGLDIIDHIEYDAYNREPIRYLPFESATDDMQFDPDAKQHTFDFYEQPKYDTRNPYTLQLLEASPLGRPLEEAAPGDLWKIDQKHTLKYDYQTNISNEVRRFKIIFPAEAENFKPELKCVGYYAYRQLYKKITKDENWTASDGRIKTTEEFTDKQGRVILKRNYSKNDSSQEIALDTYYVYDDYGKLSYVIPPLASYQIIKEARATFSGSVNFPWVKFVAADQITTDSFNTAIQGVANADILNLDLLSQYGGQGGIAASTDEAGNLILNINTTVTSPTAFRTGVVASLDGIGQFDDKEIGKIESSDYQYYFLIRDNNIVVNGYGLVPSLVETLSSAGQLEYFKNYPWTKICIADPKVASRYETEIQSVGNDDILTTYTTNDYGAVGGFSTSLTPDDNFTLSVNISANVDMQLLTGPIMTLDVQRPLDDMVLGTATGTGYSYRFEINNNVLTVSGYGKFESLNFVGSVRRAPSNEINENAKALCYIYNYDRRNNLVEKHVPDGGWTYFVYDTHNQIILTQDPNLRKSTGDNWLFSKYDILGRVTYTGTVKDPRTRDAIQYMVYHTLYSNDGETRTQNSFGSNGIEVYYTNEQYPCTDCYWSNISNGNNQPLTVLTVNYYDDYNFDTGGITPGQNIDGSTDVISQRTKGLQTGSIVNILNTSRWITTINGYDNKGRNTWSRIKNSDILSDYVISTKYNFDDQIASTKKNHVRGGENVKVEDFYTYERGQLISQSQQINDDNLELIAFNKYDELNQLVHKKVGNSFQVGNSYDDINPLQSINYTYNIRNWLTGINTEYDGQGPHPLFSYAIDYEGLYNGNISSTAWWSDPSRTKSYRYKYDGLNRLTSALYRSSTSQYESYNEDNIQYDRNGNILSLQRTGHLGYGAYGKIDDLSYIYKPMSNELLKVTDTPNISIGFSDSNTKSDDYDYDANGNMIKDLNKTIGDVPAHYITYNHLNLPEKVYFANDNYIQFIYDATGQKLQKIVNDGNISTTDYINGFVYQNNDLKYFSNPEGYARKEESGKFTHVFQYRDHLGNTRMSYADLNEDHEISTSEIIQEVAYYPLGMEHDVPGNIILDSNIGEKVKYLRQERQDELNLNWDSFRYRNYDYAIGRFFGVDPVTEKFTSISPYQFSHNNSVWKVELEGLEGRTVHSTDVINENPYFNDRVIQRTVEINATKPKHVDPSKPLLEVGIGKDISKEWSAGDDNNGVKGVLTGLNASLSYKVMFDGEHVCYTLEGAKVSGEVNALGENANGSFTTFSSEGDYNIRTGEKSATVDYFTPDFETTGGKEADTTYDDVILHMDAFLLYFEFNFNQAARGWQDLGELVNSWFESFGESYFDKDDNENTKINPFGN